MATPCQSDGQVHGAEMDHESVIAGQWHNRMKFSTRLMEGESDESIVPVFAVVGGAGQDMCCGQVGANGSRFCTKFPSSSCKCKNHRDKDEGKGEAWAHVCMRPQIGSVQVVEGSLELPALLVVVFETSLCC
jgi:hypothetical protein